MSCKKEHHSTDKIIKDLPISQGNFERHKCAACAYEKGLENGKGRVLNFNLKDYISGLEESQKGDRRHRSAIEAYTLGFLHGLNGENKHLAIKDKLKMATQMRDFGMTMVARGVFDSTFIEEDVNPYAHAMGVVNIASGFEILIKSKIVEEHPLLVFSKIPKESNIADGILKFEDLIEHGQTIMYTDLPERLWATTGYKIDEIKLYEEFGRIRNQIIHFAVPDNESLSDLSLNFAFKVIERLVNLWWDTSILEYAQEYDEKFCVYAFEQLERLGIDTNYRLDNHNKLIKKNEKHVISYDYPPD